MSPLFAITCEAKLQSMCIAKSGQLAANALTSSPQLQQLWLAYYTRAVEATTDMQEGATHLLLRVSNGDSQTQILVQQSEMMR